MPFDFQASYEALNPDDRDYRFYTELATSRDLSRVVDLGCGTGVLAVMLALAGLEVLGVDPDPEMLRVARGRAGGELVTWLQGDAGVMPTAWADLVTMSGHTAQVFITDDWWQATLLAVGRCLVPRGVLAFETRNPGARAWAGWTRQQTLRVVEGDEGPVEFWHDTVRVHLPLVTYVTTTANLVTGQTTTDLDALAFRDEVSLRASLVNAGLVVEEIWGDWDASPVTSASPELIVVARRP